VTQVFEKNLAKDTFSKAAGFLQSEAAAFSYSSRRLFTAVKHHL